MTSQPPQRRSARIVLLDQHDRVLLLKFAVTRDERSHAFWATPGGEVEPFETDLAAARRELGEELDLDLTLVGLIHEVRSSFVHEGVLTENTDVFFLGRCHDDAPRLGGLTEAERKALSAMRWWRVDEIDAATETIYPPDLSTVVRRLTTSQNQGTA